MVAKSRSDCINLRSVSEVTRILNSIEQDPKATDALLAIVYDELRRLAAARMVKLPPGQTLQATALVHEAYLRLVGTEHQTWENRGHFFSAAAVAMRRILVERARRKSSKKRGGGLKRVDLDQVDFAMDTDSDLLLALDEALRQLKEKDATGAALIELRFFAGLTNDRAAEILGISERTARRSWAYARAWLYDEIRRQL